MTPRTRAIAVVGVLLLLAVALPSVLAYTAGVHRSDTRLDELERRMERVEVDVSLLFE